MVRGLAWRWVMSRSVKNASMVGARALIDAPVPSARGRSTAETEKLRARLQIPYV